MAGPAGGPGFLLAENLAAESYLETGNRGLFEHGGDPLVLHPDLTNDQARRVAESCPPFVDDPATVEPIWRGLALRAERGGLKLPSLPATTRDPGLCLVIDGGSVGPISMQDGRHIFAVPAGTAELRLRSRSASPSETAPWISGDRRLGVQLRGLFVRSGTDLAAIPLDHPALGAGWWQPEWHSSTTLRRWTDGDALVPALNPAPGRAYLLEVDMAATVAYPTAARTTVAFPLPSAVSWQGAIRRSA